MSRYRLDSICSLARQLAFAPLDVRDRQIAAAEELLISLDPTRAYPLDYITFRVTGFQTKTQEVSAELLTGIALQHDLGLLIEKVSDTLNQRTADRAEPVLTIDDLTEKFNVTSKTIQRWRRRGLPARRFIFADQKRRVGFRLSIVEQFLATHRQCVEAKANVSEVDTRELDQMIARARWLAVHGGCSEDEIARRIARKFNRSPLTIQHTLRKYDQDHPALAILPHAARSLTVGDRATMRLALQNGDSLRSIASSLGRSRTAVYRVALDERIDRAMERKVRFIDDPLYHQPAAESQLKQMVSAETIESSPSSDQTREQTRVPSDLPAYFKELWRCPLLTSAQERALFLQFNFYKYRYNQLRRALDRAKARLRDLAELDQALADATDVKNRIVRSNLRLVVSVARKHVRGNVTLMELVSEGNIILLRAVESFDTTKGHKFSTYATFALMKGFARAVPQMLSQSRRATTVHFPEDLVDRSESIDGVLDARDQVRQLLSQLAADEQRVVEAQFGLTDGRAMDESILAAEMGISCRQVRAIGRGALAKLRNLADS